MKITHIVIHYTATFEDQNLRAVDIDKMHRARGWSMIGYHWLIGRDGKVEMGRPETMVGAHVGGQNTGKIGVCCVGGLNRATGPNVGVDNRTPAQIAAQITLIREILKRYPGAKVVGHRDLASTQCPGFDVATWWAKVQKKPAPQPAPISTTAPVKTVRVGEDDRHMVEPGETWWSIAAEHGLALGELLAINDATAGEVLRSGRTLRLVRPTPTRINVDTPAPRPAAKPEPAGFWAMLAKLFSRR
jgi:N-acetylmuramoyl-L-alanine amidase